MTGEGNYFANSSTYSLAYSATGVTRVAPAPAVPRLPVQHVASTAAVAVAVPPLNSHSGRMSNGGKASKKHLSRAAAIAAAAAGSSAAGSSTYAALAAAQLAAAQQQVQLAASAAAAQLSASAAFAASMAALTASVTAGYVANRTTTPSSAGHIWMGRLVVRVSCLDC